MAFHGRMRLEGGWRVHAMRARVPLPDDSQLSSEIAGTLAALPPLNVTLNTLRIEGLLTY